MDTIRSGMFDPVRIARRLSKRGSTAYIVAAVLVDSLKKCPEKALLADTLAPIPRQG